MKRRAVAIMAALAVALTLLVGMTAPASADSNGATITLTSGTTTTAAYGYTTNDPQTDPISQSAYDQGASGTAVPLSPNPVWTTQTQIAAQWISNVAGGANNQGNDASAADSWRLFEVTFTIPLGATDITASGNVSADNAVAVYLNNVSTVVETTGYVYGAAPSSSIPNYTIAFPFTFTPVVGTNTLYFVVRNWDNPNSETDNPTGLIYNVTINYCPAQFSGLFAPYSATKAYKIGSSIPLKWQYTDCDGNVIDSSQAAPVVNVKWDSSLTTATDLVSDNASGASGYQYDSTTDTWQFNWQTKGITSGTWTISITSGPMDMTSQDFLIQVR